MEILDLRHFSATDLRALLQEETDLWSNLLSWDYSGSAEMILRYVDARILPGYAAVERGRIHGYTFFVYEGAKGVIGDLYVEGDGARNGHEHILEGRLLTHVIETLQRSPGIHRIEAQLLLHPAGVVSRPFLQEGFRRYPRLFMTLPLERAPQPMRVPDDLELRSWSEQDYQGAAVLISAAYRGHVDSDINDQYRSVQGSLRFLTNIVRFPGCGVFDPASSYVLIEKHSRSTVGLILCSRVKPDVGHVTQVCTMPEHRGRGLGRLLLAANAEQLGKGQASLLSLTVTEANTGAVELYKRLGFTIQRVFDAFVWEG